LEAAQSAVGELESRLDGSPDDVVLDITWTIRSPNTRG
jgi:hypothetical protein